MVASSLHDPFGRTIDYLRISVTDQCNERCLYCRPASYRGWAARPEHLTAPEIIKAAKAATHLGFRHFRLTGGEPLLRPDLLAIASGLASLEGVTTLSLSTNGTRIASLTFTAKSPAGLSRNFSKAFAPCSGRDSKR